MKKAWWALFILALLFMPAVHAEETNEDFNKTIADARNVTLKALQDRTDRIAEKQIDLPKWAEPIAKFLLRLEEPYTLSHLIIVVALFVLFAVIFVDILQVFSVFSENTARVIGILLTVIMSAVGTLKSISVFLVTRGNVVKFLENWSAGALIFWIVIIVLVIFALRNIFRIAHEYQLLRIAKKEGIEAGADLSFVRWAKNTIGWMKYAFS